MSFEMNFPQPPKSKRLKKDGTPWKPRGPSKKKRTAVTSTASTGPATMQFIFNSSPPAKPVEDKSVQTQPMVIG